MTWVMILTISHGGTVLPGYESKDACEQAAKIIVDAAKKAVKEKGWYFPIELVACVPAGSSK